MIYFHNVYSKLYCVQNVLNNDLSKQEQMMSSNSSNEI